jgi:hypothetical protein
VLLLQDRDEHYWLWTGAALSAYAAAFVAVSGGLAASKNNYPFFTSAPMILAYVFGTGGLGCVVAAVRGAPFPLAKRPGSRKRRVAEVQDAQKTDPELDTNDEIRELAERIVFGVVAVSSMVVITVFAFWASFWFGAILVGSVLLLPLLTVVTEFVLRRLR